MFFNQRDGPFMPTLKLLHRGMHHASLARVGFRASVLTTAPAAVPHIMKQVRADKGAIPFVLSGANVMCPGLTSKGGDMPEELAAGTPVVGAATSLLYPQSEG
jgi:PUA domain protein